MIIMLNYIQVGIMKNSLLSKDEYYISKEFFAQVHQIKLLSMIYIDRHYKEYVHNIYYKGI